MAGRRSRDTAQDPGWSAAGVELSGGGGEKAAPGGVWRFRGVGRVRGVWRRSEGVWMLAIPNLPTGEQQSPTGSEMERGHRLGNLCDRTGQDGTARHGRGADMRMLSQDEDWMQIG